ncbi:MULTISPECIES: hypothetical protein [unclassified Anabaena]|nr:MULTISPECIES: hypothetical protein [unclassified Anabaena]
MDNLFFGVPTSSIDRRSPNILQVVRSPNHTTNYLVPNGTAEG